MKSFSVVKDIDVFEDLYCSCPLIFERVAKNHLTKDFRNAKLAKKWVLDLTFTKAGEGWPYLTVVLYPATS